MTVKINSKIVNYSVVSKDKDSGQDADAPTLSNNEESTSMGHPQPFVRPEKLIGATYKISPPIIEDSIYITINDHIFPDGTVRPVELFISSKNMASFQWVSLISRTVSALLRQPGPFPAYVIDEFLETYDPHGSYFIPGGKGQANSIAAHIGMVFKWHCTELGLIDKPKLGDAAKKVIEEKTKKYLEATNPSDSKSEESTSKTILPGAKECPKCREMTLIKMDGCDQCVECGHSKCS